jgi:hypothetical protein
MLGQSAQPYRGDEANALSPVRGYVIFDAPASYQLFEQLNRAPTSRLRVRVLAVLF